MGNMGASPIIIAGTLGPLGLSTFCLIHCLCTPFLALAIPLFKFENEMHMIGFAPLIFLAIMAFRSGYRHHKRVFPLILAVLGFFILTASLWLHEVAMDKTSTLMTISGSLILVVAHIQNIKYCHRCH